jgi:hypothetical protein
VLDLEYLASATNLQELLFICARIIDPSVNFTSCHFFYVQIIVEDIMLESRVTEEQVPFV